MAALAFVVTSTRPRAKPTLKPTSILTSRGTGGKPAFIVRWLCPPPLFFFFFFFFFVFPFSFFFSFFTVLPSCVIFPLFLLFFLACGLCGFGLFFFFFWFFPPPFFFFFSFFLTRLPLLSLSRVFVVCTPRVPHGPRCFMRSTGTWS